MVKVGMVCFSKVGAREKKQNSYVSGLGWSNSAFCIRMFSINSVPGTDIYKNKNKNEDEDEAGTDYVLP